MPFAPLISTRAGLGAPQALFCEDSEKTAHVKEDVAVQRMHVLFDQLFDERDYFGYVFRRFLIVRRAANAQGVRRKYLDKTVRKLLDSDALLVRPVDHLVFDIGSSGRR